LVSSWAACHKLLAVLAVLSVQLSRALLIANLVSYQRID
jgi:hypothetical protein